MSINPFVVVRSKGFVYEVLGDTPTPALIDASNDGRPHDAYQHPETGFWRLRDDRYDPPGTEYTSVYVASTPECRGYADMPMSHRVPFGTKLVEGRCDEHREVYCPGAASISDQPHLVPVSEAIYGSRRQCYECATYDGVPTGDELAAGRES